MKLGRIVWLCAFAALPQTLIASDPPASRRNPLNNHTEIVDMIRVGEQWEIRHTIDDGTTKPVALKITNDPADDRRPRIAISPAGDSWVCWYRELATGDRVLCRKRDYASGSWSAELLVSEPDESGRLPVVVHDGTRAWVAFEDDAGSGKSIVVNSIIDVPDPIGGCHEVGWTSFAGDREVELHFEAGRVWLTWIHSGTQVKWTRYSTATGEWEQALMLPYLPWLLDEVRESIRSIVLALEP
jgi:hypothetical protein